MSLVIPTRSRFKLFSKDLPKAGTITATGAVVVSRKLARPTDPPGRLMLNPISVQEKMIPVIFELTSCGCERLIELEVELVTPSPIGVTAKAIAEAFNASYDLSGYATAIAASDGVVFAPRSKGVRVLPQPTWAYNVPSDPPLPPLPKPVPGTVAVSNGDGTVSIANGDPAAEIAGIFVRPNQPGCECVEAECLMTLRKGRITVELEVPAPKDPAGAGVFWNPTTGKFQIGDAPLAGFIPYQKAIAVDVGNRRAEIGVLD
jgi:hypothetical protein